MDIKQSKPPLRAAYQFGILHGLANEIEVIKQLVWDNGDTALRRGYIVDLFKRQGILDQFILEHWPFGRTEEGQTMIARYLRYKEKHDRITEQEDAEEEDEGEVEGQSFAAEADLRDFLAKHLDVVEPGLTLYQEEGRTGVEFGIDNGSIDLLAMDREKRFVVIELKLGRGRNKTIGQLSYYMGWVDQHLVQGKTPCRGMIIAKSITEDLKIAVKRISGVTLHQYFLNVTISQASP